MDLDENQFEEVFSRFKLLADRKREVTTADLFSLADVQTEKVDPIHLDYLQVSSGTHILPTATVRLMCNGQRLEDAACGDGPVDAAFKAVDKVLGTKGKLTHYSLQALDGGEDTQGEVAVTVKFGENLVGGRGVSTDIIEASVLGYLQAVNRAFERGWITVREKNEG
ncbi:2-isopropylmalate synthase [Desulfosporosinus sp. BG]|nr:2-isopropylmalate synthase [Desulfosporosinus sp. BG]